MFDITAIILTKNEQKNIQECIHSIKNFVKCIYVIDSGSTDKTVEIANELGAQTVIHEFEYHAKQFNWGLDNLKITTKWVLKIDADERMTEELFSEISKHINNSTVTGFSMSASLVFLGKKLKFGGKQKHKLMLFQKEYGRIEDRKMDEHTILESGINIQLKNKFIHKDFKDINSFVKKLNWYVEREIQDYYNVGISNEKVNNLTDKEIISKRIKKYKIYYKLPSFIRAFAFFIYNYVFKLGFLDGIPGFAYSFLFYFYYRMLVDIRLYEVKKSKMEFTKLSSLGD